MKMGSVPSILGAGAPNAPVPAINIGFEFWGHITYFARELSIVSPDPPDPQIPQSAATVLFHGQR